MGDIFNWVQVHWADILAIYTGIVTVASIIVKLTPNLKDDTMLQKIIAFIGKFIALNHTVKDADRPK